MNPNGWLTLAEAADSLGISVHAVRRRARSGRLVARQIPTDRGPAWRVLVQSDAPTPLSPQERPLMESRADENVPAEHSPIVNVLLGIYDWLWVVSAVAMGIVAGTIVLVALAKAWLP
jgi:hypothetical protein